ncbi:hypothetical protein [Chryseobacterium sp. Mn2064]|uniref:hypothetical protein n=1 Tax=Chryseobacterium sp. Mn2064 TaxID=3395263 RepID=UPI003BEC253F
MNSFFKSIGLYKKLNIELNIDIHELRQRLLKITYKTNKTFISFEKDAAIPSRFEYRGMVEDNSFTIKRRSRIFDMNRSNPVFHGTISDKSGKSLVAVEFFPSGLQIFNWVAILCFCSVIAFASLQDNKDNIIVAIVASAVAVSQYFILKRGISRGRYEFERELIYIAQKP